MRILLCIILLAGLLTSVPTAIAADLNCSMIPTDSTSKEESHLLNPRQISSLTLVTDTKSVAVGTSGRYVLVITMTNGDNLLYGTYRSEELRKNAIKHINLIVLTCNQ